MHVRKFEADTIEQALKDIKRELGPDAVILKTITNSGLKGAFKKNKIEITAAISEKNYGKKSQVDSVMNTDQKDEFYGGSASYIANMIDQHDQSRQAPPKQQQMERKGYGSAGLNRAVNSTKQVASQVRSGIKSGLDDFLNQNDGPTHKEFNFDDEIEATREPVREITRPAPKLSPQNNQTAPQISAQPARLMNDEIYEIQKNKINELEKKLFELTRNVERIHKKEPIGIYQLRTTLRSLDVNEIYIQQLIKKGLFELTETEVENADIVFEFALREMMNAVQTAMPLFSSVDDNKTPVITVFLSEAACGQTSMIQKIGAMKQDAVVIRNCNSINEQKHIFAEKIFNLNVVKTTGIAEIVSECRKALEAGKTVFIDYKCNDVEKNETKKFIDGLKRAFPKVEVLITLSAIQSELYNRKVLGTYRKISDGIVVSHLDACLNFGALFNISSEMKELPYKFFGTGEVVPDDLETATAERLLAGIFKLS
jgi:flagellar biosynthesis GTPase FlhF